MKYKEGDRVYVGKVWQTDIYDVGTIMWIGVEFARVRFDNWNYGHGENNREWTCYLPELVPEKIGNSTLYKAMNED